MSQPAACTSCQSVCRSCHLSCFWRICQQLISVMTSRNTAVYRYHGISMTVYIIVWHFSIPCIPTAHQRRADTHAISRTYIYTAYRAATFTRTSHRLLVVFVTTGKRQPTHTVGARPTRRRRLCDSAVLGWWQICACRRQESCGTSRLRGRRPATTCHVLFEVLR